MHLLSWFPSPLPGRFRDVGQLTEGSSADAALEIDDRELRTGGNSHRYDQLEARQASGTAVTAALPILLAFARAAG